MNLLEQIKIYKPVGSSEVSTAATTFIDMAGWEGCLFLITKNGSSDIDSTGSFIIRQTSHVASTALGYASTFSYVFKASGRNPMAIDVYRPLKRYVSLKGLTCTGMSITAIAYGGRRLGSTEAWVNIHSSNRPSGVHVCTTQAQV